MSYIFIQILYMKYLLKLESVSHSVLPNSSRPHELQPARLLCRWDFPDENTRVGWHFLLQGVFPTQESNPHLVCLQADSLPSEPSGSPSLGYLTNRNSLSHSSGDQKSEMKCWQDWFLMRPLSLAPGILFLCPHLAFLLCKGRLMTLPFLTRVPILLDQGLTLKTSFNFN